jgi:hypothetical protein
MRALFLLVSLAACAPKRGTQSLADFGGHVILEVPLPPEKDALGAAFFDARLAHLARGRDESSPADGIALLCRARSGGRLEVRVMLDGSQLASRSGALETSCTVGDQPIPIVIRW